jgi:hypothetical protein
MTTNAIDVSSLVWSALGLVLFIGYFRFADSVIHQGNFYQARRWKAALWFTGVPGLILLTIFPLTSIPAIFNDSSGRDTIDLIESVIVITLSTLSWIIPVLFVITVATYSLLKWWRNSDALLDKIWKDPDNRQKNHVQDW